MVAAGALVACSHAHRAAAQDDAESQIVTEPPPIPTEPVPKKKPPGHLRVGGGLGFGVGTGFISVGVSPQVSYIFKRIVEPGLALRYEYTKDRVPIPDVTWHTYGGSLFVRLYPIEMLFFLIEGEIINTGFRQGDFRSGRMSYGNLLLGAGFLIGVGRGAFVATSIKFAVFRNLYYPDAFPIISVGAGYSF